MGTPLFRKVTVNLENGRKFVIETDGYAPGKYEVKDITLNGKRLKTTYITHEDIMNGGTVKFYMK